MGRGSHTRGKVAPGMRYVALLRGINVGGNRVIRMVDLRDMFVAAGSTDVATYIQSGNVVFTHASKMPAPQLTAAIKRATTFDVSIMVRTVSELAKVVAGNPFPKDADNVHVSFLPAKTTAELACGPNEAYAFVGRELYLHLPDGVGRSKLAVSANKLPGTVRNWRTISALLALATSTG